MSGVLDCSVTQARLPALPAWLRQCCRAGSLCSGPSGGTGWVPLAGPLPQSLALTEELGETFSFLGWQRPTLPCLDVYSCHWKPQGAEQSASKASMVGLHEGASTHSYFLNLLSIRERPGHWFVHGKNIKRELLVQCFFPAFAYC